jgi:ABC-type molybdenum transport system ATPase subunit/photorepair protein PhrA
VSDALLSVDELAVEVDGQQILSDVSWDLQPRRGARDCR